MTTGGPLRAATILFGSSIAITTSANTPVSSLTALRTASFERWAMTVSRFAGNVFPPGARMISVSVSVVNLCPSAITSS